jgi:hypothetical protein
VPDLNIFFDSAEPSSSCVRRTRNLWTWPPHRSKPLSSQTSLSHVVPPGLPSTTVMSRSSLSPSLPPAPPHRAPPRVSRHLRVSLHQPASPWGTSSDHRTPSLPITRCRRPRPWLPVVACVQLATLARLVEWHGSDHHPLAVDHVLGDTQVAGVDDHNDDLLQLRLRTSPRRWAQQDAHPHQVDASTRTRPQPTHPSPPVEL